MSLVVNTIESLGAKVSQWFIIAYTLFVFLARGVRYILHPSTWNRATFDVVLKQVYFTAVQILPVFLTYALLIAWLLINIILNTARDFGLTEFATEMSIRVLTLELMPFLAALFIALRSGSAINTEVALMRVHNELDALEHCQVSPMQFEFLPRLIGGVISMLTLAGLASMLALGLAYVAIYGFSLAGFDPFNQTVAKIFTPLLVGGFFLKGVLFGLAVTVIPITAGLETPKKLFMVPVSVLHGMMRVFFAIVAIEGASLALQYI